MNCRVLLTLLLLGGVQAVRAQVPAPTQVPAPIWHTGQSWRVQVPWVYVSHPGRGDRKDTGPTDSTTKFDTYRFKVLGQRTLRFEDQDGNYHGGQAVPPETCWLVSIAPEGGPEAAFPYRCYFRIEDLSLREIFKVTGKGHLPYFIASMTHGPDDGEAKWVHVVKREPYRDSIGPLVLDWPLFPLTTRGATSVGGISQTVTPDGTGVRVVLRSGTESTTQIWMPGEPWWRQAERNGRQKSRLVQVK